MPDILPSSLLTASENWRLTNAAVSGGRSASGLEPFVVSPSGAWRAKLSLHLIEEDDYLEARGFLAGLDGPAASFYVGPSDWRGQPWAIDPLTGGAITPDKRARDVAADPAYETNTDTSGALSFELAVGAGMNGTALSIRRTHGGLLRRGQYFQIGDRLHVITGVPVGDPPAPTGLAQSPYIVNVTVRPWLRADYPAGTALNFVTPRCLMRLADPDQGSIDMTTSPLADLSLDVVEAF